MHWIEICYGFLLTFSSNPLTLTRSVFISMMSWVTRCEGMAPEWSTGKGDIWYLETNKPFYVWYFLAWHIAYTDLWMWERGGRLVWVWPPASVLNWSSLRSKLSKNVSRFSFWRIVSSFRPCWVTYGLRMICRHSGQWLMRTPQCFAPSVSEHSAPVATLRHFVFASVTSHGHGPGLCQLFRCHHQ